MERHQWGLARKGLNDGYMQVFGWGTREFSGLALFFKQYIDDMKKNKTIRIKIAPQYYDAVECRIKTFEVRINDRDYCLGDWLVLMEWDNGEFTGRECVRRIKYICSLDNIGLNGWVAMSIE